MAIANYEDRFVIPTAHRETGEDAFELRGSCGFSFGKGCSGGKTGFNLFAGTSQERRPDGGGVMARTYRALAALLLAIRPKRCRRRPAKLPHGLGARRPSSPHLQRSGSCAVDELATDDIYDLQERYFAPVRPQPHRCRFICSSTSTAKAATADRRWPI